MVPDVKQMLEIQEIDKELLELKAQIGRYPIVWEQTKAKLSAAKKRLDDAKSAHETHHLDRRRIEKSLREQTDLLRKYQVQTNMVKSQKELTALSTQIEGIRARISQLEKEGLDELEREPLLREEVAKAEAAWAEVESEARKERSRIKSQMAEKKAEVEALDARRAALFVGLPDKSRQLYERTNRRHPGSAVVPVVRREEKAAKKGTPEAYKYSCGGCNFEVLHHARATVHKGDTIQTCDSCGRILSHDEGAILVEAET